MTRADDDMTVSVVITSYNQRELLVEAVQSALAQDPRPHEIVIADDGSEDGSPAAIADLESRQPGLVRGVIQPRNVGIPHNRNAALRSVTGRWVTVLDGDDVLLPGFVASMSEALVAQPSAGAAYSNLAITDAAGDHLRTKYTRTQPSGDMVAHLARGAFGLMRSMMMRTDLVHRIGGMDPRFPKHDGYVFTLRLARLAPFVYVDRCLVAKRDHPDGDSKSFDDEARLVYLRDVHDAVTAEIADLPATVRADAGARWDRRLGAVRDRIAAAGVGGAPLVS